MRSSCCLSQKVGGYGHGVDDEVGTEVEPPPHREQCSEGTTSASQGCCNTLSRSGGSRDVVSPSPGGHTSTITVWMGFLGPLLASGGPWHPSSLLPWSQGLF